MFEKFTAEFIQASSYTGKPYTEQTPNRTFWTFTLELFTDGYGNNVANIAVYHPKIEYGVQSINDINFHTVDELNRYIDKLMSRAAKSKAAFYTNVSGFEYGNVQRSVLHGQIRQFVNEKCSR